MKTSNSSKPLAMTLPALALLVLASSSPAQAEDSEWILVQEGPDIGPQMVYVSASAVKVESPRFGYVAICKAPDWTVHCYRNKERVEWIGNIEHFSGICLSNPFTEPMTESDQFEVGPTEKVKGLNCVKYKIKQRKGAATWGAKDIHVSAQAANFLCRFFYVPKIPLVPVKSVLRRNPRAQKQNNAGWLHLDFALDLRTGLAVNLLTKSWRKAPFNSHDFEVPKGLRRVSHLSDVGYSSSQRDDMKEVIEDLGFSDETRKKHSSTNASE